MGKESISGISSFIKKVKGTFAPQKMLLFGSRAGTDYLKTSDYDILIVSEKFRGVHYLKRLESLYDLWNYDARVDLLAYTPEEFEKKKRQIGITQRAAKEGIAI